MGVEILVGVLEKGRAKAGRGSKEAAEPERWRGTPGLEFPRIWSRSKLGRQSHHRLRVSGVRGIFSAQLHSENPAGARAARGITGPSKGEETLKRFPLSVSPLPPWPLHQEVFPSPTVRPGQLLTSMARSWEARRTSDEKLAQLTMSMETGRQLGGKAGKGGSEQWRLERQHGWGYSRDPLLSFFGAKSREALL